MQRINLHKDVALARSGYIGASLICIHSTHFCSENPLDSVMTLKIERHSVMWPIVSFILQTADETKTPPNRSGACHIGGQTSEKDKPPTYQVCVEKHLRSGI